MAAARGSPVRVHARVGGHAPPQLEVAGARGGVRHAGVVVDRGLLVAVGAGRVVIRLHVHHVTLDSDSIINYDLICICRDCIDN